ncbi:YoaK family protein [Fusobacterium sp.]|uniref:YoaK family protein n=3 Tax=Fusobacterium sp. TaxID=68766 RepID=UPI00262D27DD|nr:YoaK family protein [Fusobacterium sp.]
MEIKTEIENQISDSRRLAFFLSLAGGFQDAYSYVCRDHVFANAQTGNIVLMSGHLISGRFLEALHYLFPIIAFISGIYITEWIRYIYKENNILHWRQIILFVEIIAMVFVGCLPSSMNVLANVILSFSCAMQVSSFKKFRGIPFATTMCIGNMRSATEFLAKYHITKEKDFIYKSVHYYGAIFIFALGSSLGVIFSKILGLISIWIAAIFLFIGFLLMLMKE